MTPVQQMNQWVKGKSSHNDTTDQCCPDYSCCNQENKLASKRLRKEFAKQYKAKGPNDPAVQKMMMDFAFIEYETEETVGASS
jgi:hypothetical protein